MNLQSDGVAAAKQGIRRPYLLVLFSLPFYLGPDGRRWIDPLWAKDLVEHLRYIERLTLAAPLRRGAPPKGTVDIETVAGLERLKRLELPSMNSWLITILQLPLTWALLWRACRRSAVVHSAIAGWPIPEAWVLAPILWLLRRPYYVNVESAFWRIAPGESATLYRRGRAWLTEYLNSRCLKRAGLITFTQDEYRCSMLGASDPRGHVVEASWVDREWVIEPDALSKVVAERQAAGVLRVLFAGRLVKEKGVLLLLDAVLPLTAEFGVPIALDIIGEGPLRAECERRIHEANQTNRVRLLPSVNYDESFRSILRQAHLLVVPSLSDEQPRIVYDAYSQGVPVIASDTPGLAQCVEDGSTGRRFERGSAEGLRQLLRQAALDPRPWANMARNCVQRVMSHTHGEMHGRRCRLLLATFPSLGESPNG